MSKIAEKQIVLLDACQGLLTRVYNLINFEMPNHFDETLDKLCEYMVQKFPAYPEGMEKVRYQMWGCKRIRMQSSIGG
jgi:hypothetical protein